MFFRFGSALVLVVLVSLAGVGLEKETLELRRSVSRQHYRLEVLMEQHARLRLKTQQLGAPVRTIRSLEKGELDIERPHDAPAAGQRRFPLLQWQRPFGADADD